MKGRPKLPPHERKADAIRVRLTPAERAKIEAKADQAEMTISEYLRASALKSEIKIVQGRQLEFAVRHELGRIGVNLNQIAKAMNARQQHLPASHAEATETLQSILQVIYADISEDL